MPSPLATDLSGLAGWVLDVIQAMGAVGVAGLVVLENVFPPLPSEVVLPLAGWVLDVLDAIVTTVRSPGRGWR